MAYSYDDFVSAANKAGLMGEFSQSDLTLARKHPEAGMSILGFKQDIHKAKTPEAKQLAHSAAEEIRKSYGNYTGGETGSQHKSAGKIPGQVDTVLDQIYSFQPSENPYRTQYQDALDKITSFGDFSFGPAPTYENQYQEQQKALLDAIINREDFSWSKEQDPLWPVYKKEYLREGERATADALGQVSAASGGRPSSYAATAATQAGDYYATKLNDIIPELYQQAYDKYLSEYQMKLQDLGTVNGQEQMDYAKYLDQLGQYNTDRGFSYQRYLDDFARQLQGLDALESAQRLRQDTDMNDFSILQGKLGSLQSQDAVDRNAYLDALDRAERKEQLDYQRQQADREFQQNQVDAILSAGGTPTEEMVAASGLNQTYVNALREAYLRQQSQKAARASSGRSSGGSRSSGGGKPKMTLAQAQTAIKNGQVTDAVVYAYDYYMGDGAYQKFFGETESGGRSAGGNAGGNAGGDRSSLGYQPDEGVFTWNGKNYASAERLLNDIGAANLSSGELETLKKKFKAYGFNLE